MALLFVPGHTHIPNVVLTIIFAFLVCATDLQIDIDAGFRSGVGDILLDRAQRIPIHLSLSLIHI